MGGAAGSSHRSPSPHNRAGRGRQGGKGWWLEVFFEEAEAEVLAVRPDDFGKCRRATEEDLDFPFLLLRHLPKHLGHRQKEKRRWWHSPLLPQGWPDPCLLWQLLLRTTQPP